MAFLVVHIVDILYEKCGLPRLLCMSFDALSLLVSIVVGLAEVAFHFFFHRMASVLASANTVAFSVNF